MVVRHRSNFYLPTRKETPQEAEIPSHRLMIRAGLIRRLTRGVYTYLPLAKRVLDKIEEIVREEMNEAGAREAILPILQPRKLWERSGRWEEYGPEMMRLQDRHEREYGLGPTHEEVITELVQDELLSYRDTPVNLYQIGTKFRDEIRPRFGIMRAREFIMKDAYSFGATTKEARETYDRMDQAYRKICDRIGFEYRRVEAATGAIGGSRSHEFMVIAETGEDQVIFCEGCNYAANQEQAESPSASQQFEDNSTDRELEKFETPGVHSIDDLEDTDQDAKPFRQIKTMVFRVKGEPTALLVPGDYQLNEIKLQQHSDGDLEEMTEVEIKQNFGAHTGSLGAVDVDDIRIWADPSLQSRSGMFTGANEDGYHYRGVDVSRDIEVDRWLPLRVVQEGDQCPDCGDPLQREAGIEVGHIFYLGQKYSEALDATITDPEGNDNPLIMGCYGIGVSRIMAAAIEQSHDDKGIIWPASIAPFDVYILVINWDNDVRRAAAQDLASELENSGYDVIVDDRDESAGVKFNESELLGIPVRVTVGRDLEKDEFEVLNRSSGETKSISVEETPSKIREIVDTGD